MVICTDHVLQKLLSYSAAVQHRGISQHRYVTYVRFEAIIIAKSQRKLPNRYRQLLGEGDGEWLLTNHIHEPFQAFPALQALSSHYTHSGGNKKYFYIIYCIRIFSALNIRIRHSFKRRGREGGEASVYARTLLIRTGVPSGGRRTAWM